MEHKMMRISEAAEYLGIGPVALRQYCNNGEVKYARTPKGHRVFKKEDLDELLGKTVDITPANTAFYVRASDGNKATMQNQLQELVDAYGQADNIYKDGASGLNEKRTGLKKLLRDVEEGKIKQIYATYPDRITRFGITFVEHIFNQAGCKIDYLHEKNQTPQEELMEDFMKLIASFSGKFYQMRSYENQHKLLDSAHAKIDEKQKASEYNK